MFDKVTVSLRVLLLLTSLVAVHALGGLLAKLGIISDTLLLLGALAAYKLVVDEELRGEVVRSIDVVDVESVSDFLIKNFFYVISALNIDASRFVEEEDILVDLSDLEIEEEIVDEQLNEF